MTESRSCRMCKGLGMVQVLASPQTSPPSLTLGPLVWDWKSCPLCSKQEEKKP